MRATTTNRIIFVVLLLVSVVVVSACVPIEDEEEEILDNQMQPEEIPELNAFFSEEDIISSTLCSDTDKGINTLLKGTITEDTGNTFTDLCRSANSLNEYYCRLDDGRKHSRLIDCSTYGDGYTCVDGACINSSNQ